MSLIFNKKDIYPNAKTAFKFSLKSTDELKQDCLFVLDANVLLLPFTTDGKSLEEIKTIYQGLVKADRLFLPAQAVREFLDNRATKLTEVYKSISDKSSQNFKYVCPHPLLSGMSEYSELENIESELKEVLKKYRKQLHLTLGSIKDWGWDDPVSKMYHEVLSERVLDDSNIDLKEVEKDLERRNKLKIPPGYKDGSKDANQAGDILIWNELLNLAIEKNANVIFVSSDEKVDWWHKSDKKAIYPRFELVDEFREATDGKSFHIVSLSKLLSIFEASDDVVTAIKFSETEISDAIEKKGNINKVAGHDVTDEYKSLINIPDDHSLRQISSEWKVKGGYDIDTYGVVELDEKGVVVASYEVYDSTKTSPPFSRELFYRKVGKKI